jgi:predicted MFS family arabinose efflux permease
MIWMSYISLLVLSWLDNIRSPFFPDIIQSLALNGTQASLFFAVTSLVAFLTSLTGAHWLKKYSSLTLMQGSLFILSIGFFFISRSSNFLILLVFCGVFGIGYGMLNFAQNIVIQEYASPLDRRRIFSGLHSMYAVAALLAPLSATLFDEFGWDWRRAFLILSILPLILAILSRQLFAKDGKHALRMVHREGAISPKALWIAAFSVAFYMFGEITVSTRLVLWLRSEFAFSPIRANTYLALFFALLLSGRLVFTFVHFHFSNARVLITSALASSCFLVLALVHHPLWMALSGIAMSPFYPVAMNHLAELFGHQAAKALAFGIGLSSLAIVILHFTLGLLTDFIGLGHALWVAPLGLICVAILISIQPKSSYEEM